MRFFSRKRKSHQLFTRGVAGSLLPIVLYFFGPGQAAAQTFRGFEQSKSRIDLYFDRATRVENEQAWTNYVDLGIATERVQWENDAYEVLSAHMRQIDVSGADEATKRAQADEAAALFEAAGEAWDEDASEARETERGKFLAEKEAVAVAVAERAGDEYEAIIAAAEAAVADLSETSLSDWEAAIATNHADLVAAFEVELGAELDRARADQAALDGTARAAFESELTQIADGVRREFEIRDSFYITRARNRYVALKRGDDLNARLATEESSAEAVTENIIAATEASLASETSDALKAALAEADELASGPAAADFEAAGTNWEARMEGVIDAGLKAWQQAEEDLYAKRLAWQQTTDKSREEGNQIWQQQYDELIAARNRWIQDVQQQIQAGRDQWQAKFTEFDASRTQSETELTQYIQAERERWDAASQELANIVNGGGAALLETKDAFRYYEEVMAAIGPPGSQDPRDVQVYQFYQQQRDYMAGAVGRFQGILATAEGVLAASMHSNEDHTGLLNDVRLFAGNLPEVVAALDEDDFEESLGAEMQARGEDFLLYRRDIERIMESNALFVKGAEDLEDSVQFEFEDAASISALSGMVAGIDRKYDAHRGELETILNEDRSALAGDTERLADMKTDIAAWLELSTNSDQRLKRETTKYFNDGLGGYYLTGNEGDPYLMTRAEYEWELLRRERNHLMKKLRRAEEVKRYADLAFQNEAGLEMAAVTKERAALALTQRDLKEISYLLIKGDPALGLNPAAFTDPAVADAELDRILGERGIDRAALAAREATLTTERALLDEITGISGSANVAEVADIVSQIDIYLAGRFPDGANNYEAARADHPTGIVRTKLLEYRARLEAGASAAELTDRWTSITGGAGALRGELQLLADDYDFAGMRTQITTLRGQVDDENLGMIQNDLGVIKEKIAANATLLAQAKAELDLAKEAYRQARIDFDVIRAGNSEDLIRLDLQNTTGMLAMVTHRMSKIEDIDGFNGTYDATTEQRIRYLNEISQRESAVQDLTDSETAYALVQGLEESKRRGRELESLIQGAGDLNALGPEAIADLFVNAKALVLTEGNASTHLNSGAAARDALGTIEYYKSALGALETALDTAIANGDAARVALARADLNKAHDGTYRAAELFVAAVRGEEKARLAALYHYLDDPTQADPNQIAEQAGTETEALYNEAFDLSAAAASEIDAFIAANPERSFAELLATANARVEALPRTVRLDAGSGGRTGLADPERAKWNIVRDWVIQNRGLFDWANEVPDAGDFDQRGVSEKWTEVRRLAAALAADGGVYQEFADGVPENANDAWVVQFSDERAALKTKLNEVLGANDAGLSVAYAGLTSAEKELIYGYAGAPDTADARQLRKSLEVARQNAGLEAAAAPTEYRAFYFQEQVRANQKQLAGIEIELDEKGARLDALENERAGHIQYRTYLTGLSDPTKAQQIADLSDRILTLDASIAAQKPGLRALEDQARRAAALLREAQSQGGSVPLFEQAAGELYLNAAGVAMRETALAFMEGASAAEDATTETTALDQVKAIIGFFETTRTGEIRRDGSGTAIVAQEFLDAGITDPAADLASLLSGNRRGDELTRWAERLSEAAADETKAKAMSPEVLAAVQGLEGAIRGVLTAREFIDRRYQTAAEIKTEAAAAKASAEGRLDKLSQLAELESNLQSAIESAVQSEQNPVDAALAILEDPTNAAKLRLFAGYDAPGAADGITDPAAQAKIDELLRIAARLRQARLDRAVLETAGAYAETQGEYAARVSADRDTLAPDRQAILNALTQFDATAARAGVTATEATRAALWTYAAGATNDPYYRSTIIAVLTGSQLEGQALKDAVLTAIDATESEIQDRLGLHFDTAEFTATRDGETRVRTSVAAFMTAYATRGTTARGALQPVVDAINELSALSDAQTTARAALAGIATGENEAALLTIRQEIAGLINNAADTLMLKTSVTNYLTTLNDPDQSTQDALTEQLYTTTLHEAIATVNLTDEFEASDVPEELRELVLTRAYTRAKQRYSDYQNARSSQIASERENASLDLSGINGQIATRIMVNDYNEWKTGNDPNAYRANQRAAGEGASLGEYLNGYFKDRNTTSAQLPAGGQEIAARILREEYARLQSQIASGGIAAVNEKDYFDELGTYILMLKAKDYFTRNGTTLTGATVAERSANFKTTFEALLNDTTYNIAGKTLGRQYIGASERDHYQAAAFAFLEENPPIDSYLPLDSAELTQTNKTADEYLPDALRAIAGYATADYRAMAANVNAQTQAALARLEVNEQAGAEDFSAILSDAELGAIVDRAGYPTLPAATRDALVAMLKAQNILSGVAGATTAEQAAAVLRQKRVLEYYYPTSGEQQAAEEFLTREGERSYTIEEKLFEALGKRHADLRETAKENRGALLRAIVEHERGTDTTFYNNLSATLKTELNALHTEVWGKLTTAEKDALLTNAGEYERVFDLRSGQELVASGIIETAEAAIVTAIQRGTSATARALLADQGNRATLTQAYIETIHKNAGQRGALSAATQALLDANPDLAAAVTRAVNESDPEQRGMLERENAMITRFYELFAEDTATRREIGRILDNPDELNPDARLSATYEIQRSMNLLAREEAELTGALTAAADDHKRYFANMEREVTRDAARASDLIKFAIFRGDDYQTSRFSNYRTYVGAERQYQQDNFAAYENNGGTLEAESMGIADVEGLLNGDWEATLKSDGTGTFKTVTNDDGEQIQIRAVKAVSNAQQRYRGSDPASQAAEMRATYFENLANNYLEAAGSLNNALNAVWVAAKMSDTREAKARVDIKKTVKDNYNATATTAQDLSTIQDLKINAQSRVAAHNESEINKYAQGIEGTIAQAREMGETFAGAGRRKQISGMSLTAYLENRFNEVAAEMTRAENNHTTLSNIAEQHRNEFAARNRNLADGLSEMAERWRGFEAANEEYEERAAVKEYAETPYLYASKADASDQANSEMLAEYRGDAKEEYERAQAAVDAANARLKQAGYAVQTQDDLEEFNAIVTEIDAGTTFPPLDATAATRLLKLRDRKFNNNETLNAAEEVELTTLTRREMYTRYADLIDTQAEHIKHTMRMIRLHKASEIVNAEIMRLRAVSDEKQKKFEDELGKTYGNFTDGNAETARNGVYLRLGNLVENNGSFFREFRGWYYGATDFVGEAAQAWGTSTSNVQGGVIVTYTMRQILEAATGHMDKNAVNATDKGTIGAWMSYGGSMSEFGQFSGTYFGFLMSIGAHDKAELTYQIMRNIYGGMAGSLLYGGAARAKINTAKMQWEIAVISMAASLKRSMDQASKASTMRVMNMQKEYEDSLAKLYYFTHIPDLATFKDRMIKYGTSNRDDDSTEALFQILENQNEFGEMVNDLRYLRDEKSGYVNSNGSAYTPDAEEADNTLDVSSKLEKTEYRDALGRRYDPATLRSSPPGPIEGGFYRGNDGLYTRIVLSRPDRSTYYAYAKTQPDTDPKQDVYDMGKVLEMMVGHGTAIRNDRLAQYANAGEATAAQIQDKSFVLNERDQTYQFLFEQAAGHRVGGREFSGYRLTYEDYNGNSAEVFNNELTQREQVQKKEWDLRQQELNDRYQAWEARIATIMERGKKSWDGAESRFLQSQRQWNREFDQKEEAGRKVWDEKIKEHFTKKKNWEDETRQNASETTIQRVLSEQVQKMNSQLAAAAVAMNVDIQQINMTAAINEAIQEMRNEMPSGSERLKEINASIAKFSSKLSIAELTGADFLNTALNVGSDFEDAMKEHQRRMKILTNVKIFEQYRTMSRSFEESIDDQNQAVDDRTSADAFQAGFVRNGGIFIKQGDNSRGVVHAYKWFDVRGALKAEKAKAGFAEMEGDELIGFLENRNEVEVEAFFYTQKLALQNAIERIQGRGNAPSGSRDPNEIGLFNEWKGDTGNGMMRQAATRGAGNSMGGMSNAANRDQAIDIATAGFGEIGARGQRPGGAPLGFYPELEYMQGEMAKQEASAGPGSNAFATTLNQFNPLEMYEKVEVGSRAHGYDRGKLINAQGAAITKTLSKVAGNVLVAVGTVTAVVAGWTGAGFAAGVATAAAGAALIAASNATNVDTTTGETSMKMTDSVALQSVVEIGSSALGAGFGAVAGTAASAAWSSGLSAAGGSLVGSAIKSNRYGSVTGLGFSSAKEQNTALFDATVAGVGAAYGAGKAKAASAATSANTDIFAAQSAAAAPTAAPGMLAQIGEAAFETLTSTFQNVTLEYTKQRMGLNNSVAALEQGGGFANAIGSVFGKLAGAALSTSANEITEEHRQAEMLAEQAQNYETRNPNRTPIEQEALAILRGGAYVDDKKRQAAIAILSQAQALNAAAQKAGFPDMQSLGKAFEQRFYNGSRADTEWFLSDLDRQGVDTSGLRTWAETQRERGVRELPPKQTVVQEGGDWKGSARVAPKPGIVDRAVNGYLNGLQGYFNGAAGLVEKAGNFLVDNVPGLKTIQAKGDALVKRIEGAIDAQQRYNAGADARLTAFGEGLTRNILSGVAGTMQMALHPAEMASGIYAAMGGLAGGVQNSYNAGMLWQDTKTVGSYAWNTVADYGQQALAITRGALSGDMQKQIAAMGAAGLVTGEVVQSLNLLKKAKLVNEAISHFPPHVLEALGEGFRKQGYSKAAVANFYEKLEFSDIDHLRAAAIQKRQKAMAAIKATLSGKKGAFDADLLERAKKPVMIDGEEFLDPDAFNISIPEQRAMFQAMKKMGVSSFFVRPCSKPLSLDIEKTHRILKKEGLTLDMVGNKAINPKTPNVVMKFMDLGDAGHLAWTKDKKIELITKDNDAFLAMKRDGKYLDDDEIMDLNKRTDEIFGKEHVPGYDPKQRVLRGDHGAQAFGEGAGISGALRVYFENKYKGDEIIAMLGFTKEGKQIATALPSLELRKRLIKNESFMNNVRKTWKDYRDFIKGFQSR